MDRLTQLVADLGKLDAQLDQLLSNDSLTDEQVAEHDRLVADRAKKVDAISREKARLARDDERRAIEDDASKRARTVAVPTTGRQSDTDVPNAGRTTPAVAVKEPNYKDDPKGGYKNPREFMLSVMEAGMGRRVDERLRHRYMTVGSDEARGNSDPAGGFLVPTAFSPDLLSIGPEADPIGAATTKVPMASPHVRIPARVDTSHATSVSGGLTVTRRPETVAGTASNQTFMQVVLDAHSLFGLSYATEEILADSPISFVALLEQGFRDQFIYALVNERINGTGVGEYLGVLNAPCLVTVSKETGQAATTLVYENVLKMRARCWGYGSAFWLANHDAMPQLMLMNQSVGTGGVPVWQPSAREDAPDMLLGRPLIFTEYCQTLGTVGDLILGNWSQYLEGTYQPMQSAESIHVRFVNHERAFKFWMRNAGQPWWKAALTPKNGSNTLSPFVALATRS